MILLAFLLYRLGVGLETVVYPVAGFFLLRWYWKASDRWSILAICSVLLIVASGIGGRICTQLYYKNVSSDALTVTVGDLFTILYVIALSVASILLIISKKARQEKQQLSE